MPSNTLKARAMYAKYGGSRNRFPWRSANARISPTTSGTSILAAPPPPAKAV